MCRGNSLVLPFSFGQVLKIYNDSSRTGNILVPPSHSSIRFHVESKCDVDVTEDNFKVLSASPNNLDLRILESL